MRSLRAKLQSVLAWYCCKQVAGHPPPPVVPAQCPVKTAIAAHWGTGTVCHRGARNLDKQGTGRRGSNLSSYLFGLSFDPWTTMWCDWWPMEIGNEPAISFSWTMNTYPADQRGGITSLASSIQGARHYQVPVCSSQAQPLSSDKTHLHHKFLKAQVLH